MSKTEAKNLDRTKDRPEDEVVVSSFLVFIRNRFKSVGLEPVNGKVCKLENLR